MDQFKLFPVTVLYSSLRVLYNQSNSEDIEHHEAKSTQTIITQFVADKKNCTETV